MMRLGCRLPGYGLRTTSHTPAALQAPRERRKTLVDVS
jgi:hypothetical protein